MSDATTPLVAVLSGDRLARRLPALTAFTQAARPSALSQHPGWLGVLRDGLDHDTYAVEASVGGEVCGYLPLSFVRSALFGRFLVSLPYLNSNGVVAQSPDVQSLLINRAVRLADELDARHLELRHETPIDHPALDGRLTSKVHMRLPLPATTDALWKGLDAKVRNQVRKGEKGNFTMIWGGLDRLDDFYAVMARNMRDLGTPLALELEGRAVGGRAAEVEDLLAARHGAVEQVAVHQHVRAAGVVVAQRRRRRHLSHAVAVE